MCSERAVRKCPNQLETPSESIGCLFNKPSWCWNCAWIIANFFFFGFVSSHSMNVRAFAMRFYMRIDFAVFLIRLSSGVWLATFFSCSILCLCLCQMKCNLHSDGDKCAHNLYTWNDIDGWYSVNPAHMQPAAHKLQRKSNTKTINNFVCFHFRSRSKSYQISYSQINRAHGKSKENKTEKKHTPFFFLLSTRKRSWVRHIPIDIWIDFNVVYITLLHDPYGMGEEKKERHSTFTSLACFVCCFQKMCAFAFTLFTWNTNTHMRNGRSAAENWFSYKQFCRRCFLTN